MKGSTPPQKDLPSAMGASAEHLCAPQTHDVSYVGERAQGSLGVSLWSERFNSPSPTIAPLTYPEKAMPQVNGAATHTLVNTQAAGEDRLERLSRVLSAPAPAGTHCDM